MRTAVEEHEGSADFALVAFGLSVVVRTAYLGGKIVHESPKLENPPAGATATPPNSHSAAGQAGDDDIVFGEAGDLVPPGAPRLEGLDLRIEP